MGFYSKQEYDNEKQENEVLDTAKAAIMVKEEAASYPISDKKH